MPIFWRVLIINGCRIFSKALPESIEMIIWFLYFNLLTYCITLIVIYINHNHIDIWFAYIEESLHSWNKPNLIMEYESFWCVAEFCLLKFCWGFLHLCSSMILTCSFLFFVLSLSYFGIRVMVASQNEFGSVPSSAVFWKSFRTDISSSLNVW